MRNPAWVFACAFFALWILSGGESLADGQSTYQAVVDGKDCSQSSMENWQCHYVIGEDVEILIEVVDNFRANITFIRSNGLEGDYIPTLNLEHGCVLIQPGYPEQIEAGNDFDYAFISPANGDVFKTWQECKQTLPLFINSDSYGSCSDR